jgi:hypothetical protein
MVQHLKEFVRIVGYIEKKMQERIRYCISNFKDDILLKKCVSATETKLKQFS